MILTLRATPATPLPLWVACAIVPVTWVPWPWSSLAWAVVVDEVVGLDELQAAQILDLVVAAVILVGDAGVEDGDDHAAAVGQLPRLGHAELTQVPLLAVERIVGEPGPGRGRRRDRGGRDLGRRQREGGVGLGDLDARGLREGRQDPVAAGRVDLGAIDLLVVGLIRDQHQIEAEALLEGGDRGGAGVVAQVDDDLVGVGAQGGDPIGLELGRGGAGVVLRAQEPPQEDDRDQHQQPQERGALRLLSVHAENCSASRRGCWQLSMDRRRIAGRGRRSSAISGGCRHGRVGPRGGRGRLGGLAVGAPGVEWLIARRRRRCEDDSASFGRAGRRASMPRR
jgi:hypothetical protein